MTDPPAGPPADPAADPAPVRAPIPARAWAAVLLRMPVFWLALLACLPVAGSVARLVYTQTLGAEVEARAVEITGEVVRRETSRARGNNTAARFYLHVRYAPPGGAERVALVRVSHGHYTAFREGDPIPLRVLPDRPGTTDVFGETVTRWYYELPVIALFLFFAGVIVAATVRDLRQMRTALAHGAPRWGLVTEVTGRGPLKRVHLRASPEDGRVFVWGRSLWLRPATARRLADAQWVPVIYAFRPHDSWAFWTGDMPVRLPDPDTPRPHRLPFDPMRPNLRRASPEPPP